MAAAAVKEEKAPVPVEAVKKSEESVIFKLDAQPTDLGRPDSMRFNVLTLVLDDRYDKAIQELKEMMEKPSLYPNYHERIRRYMSHSVDLIYAIKAKRNFPGINSLTRAKQQELREKFKEHFKELQMVLVRVEKVETDLRIDDARSTIYVVRALWYAVFAIVLLAFVIDLLSGLGMTTAMVISDSVSQIVDAAFALIGF